MREGERTATAYHEAGHAVQAWACGLPIESATIVAEEDCLGRVLIEPAVMDVFRDGSPYEHTPEYEVFRAIALNDVAGEVAVSILNLGSPIDWGEWVGCPGADIDSFTTVAMALGWGDTMEDRSLDLRPYLETAEVEVRTVLKERWGAVVAIANALLERGTISGEEVVRLADAAVPTGRIRSVYDEFLAERAAEQAARLQMGLSD